MNQFVFMNFLHSLENLKE